MSNYPPGCDHLEADNVPAWDEPVCDTCNDTLIVDCPDCDGSGEIKKHNRQIKCPRCKDIIGKVYCPDCNS